MAYIDLRRQIAAIGLPVPETEFRFMTSRRFRFDYAWPSLRLALEVEGGVFARSGARKCHTCGQTPPGRHLTGKGFENDRQKYNEAVLLGWRVIKTTPREIKSGEALTLIERALRPLDVPLVSAVSRGELPLGGNSHVQSKTRTRGKGML